jgi:hypothetical protein
MKTDLLKLSLYSIITALAIHTAQAENKEDKANTRSETGEPSSSQGSPGILLSKLMDADFKSANDEDLGQLEELLINPQTGKVEFAVLARGGFLGIGEKLVPIPWQAVRYQSEDEFTVSVDKEKLKSAPTVDKTYANIKSSSYVTSIYQHFGLQQAVGGADSPGGAGEDPSQPSDSSRPQDSDAKPNRHQSDSRL